MTPEQLDLVRRTATLVERALDQCELLLRRPFRSTPPCPSAVRRRSWRATSGTLLDELLLSPEGDLHDPWSPSPGSGHRACATSARGSTPELRLLGEALLAAMAAVVGERWTDRAEASAPRVCADR